MKQLILCVALMIGATSLTQAQTSGGQGSKNLPQSSNTTKTRTATKTTTRSSQKDSMANNRVEYKSKKTKQVATESGQQATGTNGTHANNPKNAGKSEEQ